MVMIIFVHNGKTPGWAPPAGGTAAGTPVQTAAWKRPFLFTSEYVFIVPQNDTV